MSKDFKRQRGDTVVEVLLGLTLLSAILFSCWALVNRSAQISFMARQRVVMVNHIKEQAEALKAMYASNKSAVTGRTFSGGAAIPFIASAAAETSPCEASRGSAGGINGKVPTSSFFFNANGVVSAVNSVKNIDAYSNAWVWMQMVDGDGYIDFYVRSCWQTAGGQQQEDNSQVIVRLNK